MFSLVTIILIAVFGLLLHILSFVLVRRVKASTQKSLREDIFAVVPNIVLIAAGMFFITFNSTFRPPQLEYNRNSIQTLQDAEKRIDELESYTREVWIHLESERRQMFMLMAVLGLLYAIPLFAFALILTKSESPETENDIVEELK